MATKDDFSQNSTEKGVPGEPAGPMALPTGESSRSLADFNEKKKKALFTNHRTVLQNSPVVSNSFPVFGLYLKLPLRKAQLESKVLSASDHQSSRGAKVKWRSAKAEVSSFQTHNSHLHTPFPSGDPGVGSQWVANALCPKKRRKITHTYT